MSNKLLMRRLAGDGTLILLTRRNPASAWVEVHRGKNSDPAAVAEMDRKQRLFETELVREVFLDMMDEELEHTT